MTWQAIEDVPSDKALFGFPRLASSLAAVLRHKRKSAFVLGLHGPWGAGKTTLLHAIAAVLPATYLKIEFNAWKYQNRDALGRALILRVLDALKQNGGDAAKIEELERSLYESFEVTETGPLRVNWANAASEAFLGAVSLAGLGFGGPLVAGFARNVRSWFSLEKDSKEGSDDLSKRVERVTKIFEREATKRAVRNVVSIEQFLSLFRDVVGQLAEDRRVIVLIDDLDRCLPDEALEVFEAIKLFLDADRCAFVLAVDRAVIRRGLELRYPRRLRSEPPIVDADEYIEKTISMSVDLPMLGIQDAREILKPAGLTDGMTPEIVAAIIQTLGPNPRRLKRFGVTVGFWMDVARSMEQNAEPLAFSPNKADNHPLFVKLALVSYLNSGLMAQIQRDPELAVRLQNAANEVILLKDPATIQAKIREKLRDELPIVHDAAKDPALWRAIGGWGPNLSPKDGLDKALRWFRSAAH